MIRSSTSSCPKCGGDLKYYDKVRRIVRTKNGETNWIKIRRLVCSICGTSHRELPDNLMPYKHYDAGIIKGVLDNTITFHDLDYEDHPCEMTMKRWKDAHKKHIL